MPDYLQVWITARERHILSHAQAQMARKLGKLDDADQKSWKLPLPAFIESLDQKRFGKDRSDLAQSLEQCARLLEQKKAARCEAKRLRRKAAPRASISR